MDRRRPRHVLDVLHDDHYSPEELADLLDMDVSFVRHEAFCGRLHAFICDHRIMSIRREDVLAWMANRGLASVPAAATASGKPRG